jgi:hypothetical protein
MNIEEVNLLLGRRVRILRCEHYDIKAGAVGIVTDVFEHGWGVEVEGTFIITGTTASRVESKETVYVEKDAIEPL